MGIRVKCGNMADDNALREFLEQARQRGTSEEAVVGLLRGRGWSEEAVYHALAEDYESRSGVTSPTFGLPG